MREDQQRNKHLFTKEATPSSRVSEQTQLISPPPDSRISHNHTVNKGIYYNDKHKHSYEYILQQQQKRKPEGKVKIYEYLSQKKESSKGSVGRKQTQHKEKLDNLKQVIKQRISAVNQHKTDHSRDL